MILAYVSLFLFGLSDNLRGPLFADLLREFSLSNSQGSLFFSVSSLISMLGALVAPKLIERRGHLTSLWIFMALMSLAFVGYALSPSFAWILFCAVFFGIAVGGLGVTQNLLVLQGADEARRGRAQGGLHAAYGLSSLLAPGIVIATALLGFGWKINFLVPASLSFLLVIAIWFLQRRTPARPTLEEHESSARARRSMGFPEVYWAILLSLYVALELMVSTRVTLLFREGYGFDVGAANVWTSVFFVGLFVGRVAYTVKPLPVALGRQLAVSLFLGATMLALGLWHRPEWIPLAGFALSIFYPVWMTTLARIFPDSFQRVASMGIALTGVSVVFMHTVIGALTDKFGLISAYTAVPILSAIGGLMVIGFAPLFRPRLGAGRMP